MTMTLHAAKKSQGLNIIDFLQPHWKSLTLALLAVACEVATDVLEPWPLKIVIDYVLQSKRPPDWMSVMVGWIGQNKLAVLSFAVAAVAVIAIVGALSSLLEKYLTTSVGQWVITSCAPKMAGVLRAADGACRGAGEGSGRSHEQQPGGFLCQDGGLRGLCETGRRAGAARLAGFFGIGLEGRHPADVLVRED